MANRAKCKCRFQRLSPCAYSQFEDYHIVHTRNPITISTALQTCAYCTLAPQLVDRMFHVADSQSNGYHPSEDSEVATTFTFLAILGNQWQLGGMRITDWKCHICFKNVHICISTLQICQKSMMEQLTCIYLLPCPIQWNTQENISRKCK